MSLFNWKPQISYNRSSLDKAAELLRSIDRKSAKAESEHRDLTAEEIPEAEYVEEVSWYDLKKGVTYYVINPGPEGEKGNPVNLPGVNRHYAFVRLSTVLKKINGVTNVNEVKFNIYNDSGELISRQISSYHTGFEVVINEYNIPPNCIFLDADKLLSAPQSAGNKRKKHSSNKLSKRRVKTKSRRRNNISHRRK
jgi:hypothetical protein